LAGSVYLVGDIGGTHTRLALVAPTGRTVRQREFASGKVASLEAALLEFLGSITPKPRIKGAALAIAGPVVNGRCVATNLPWIVDERVIARKVKIPRVRLLNDLVALALGAIKAPRSKLRPINGLALPQKGAGNVAVIAAGTGLGEASLVWDGKRFVPSATEGGHADFSPGDDVEIELLKFLRNRFGHVSWERVLSGNGFGSLYDFFVQGQGVRESPELAEAIASAPDRNAAISNAGLSGESPAAARALDLFARLYGAEAGNLALKTMALGGVYVCGAIAAHARPVLSRGAFEQAFRAKGRFARLMETIPVVVVLDDDVGLAGSRAVALGKVLS
jgi:glucokinase